MSTRKVSRADLYDDEVDMAQDADADAQELLRQSIGLQFENVDDIKSKEVTVEEPAAIETFRLFASSKPNKVVLEHVEKPFVPIERPTELNDKEEEIVRSNAVSIAIDTAHIIAESKVHWTPSEYSDKVITVPFHVSKTKRKRKSLAQRKAEKEADLTRKLKPRKGQDVHHTHGGKTPEDWARITRRMGWSLPKTIKIIDAEDNYGAFGFSRGRGRGGGVARGRHMRGGGGRGRGRGGLSSSHRGTSANRTPIRGGFGRGRGRGRGAP